MVIEKQIKTRNKISISCIIPIYKITEDENRLRNFKFVISRIIECKDIDEIIIAEQVDTNKSNKSCKLKSFSLIEKIRKRKKKRIKHIILEDSSGSGLLNKCKLCNHAAKIAKGMFLLFNDSDIYFDYKMLVTKMDILKPIIKPFKFFVKLNKEQSKEFVDPKKRTARIDPNNNITIKELGAGSIIIRKDTFESVRGYNESFVGWGFEDREFALRISKLFNVYEIFESIGVHLYHTHFTNLDYLNNNSKLFRNAEKKTEESVLTYINSIESNIPREKSNDKILQKVSKSSSSNERKIIHVINVSEFNGLQRLKDTQEITLKSIREAKIENVTLIAATSDKSIKVDWFNMEVLNRDATTEFKDKRDLSFLKDLLDIAYKYANDDDWILFTNSDCAVSKRIYNHVLEENSCKVIEFHRLDILNMPKTLEDLKRFPSELFKIGIDGIAIKASYYRDTRNLIPDFLIGEPHWDTCISWLYHKKTEVQTNVIDLYHARHERTWNINNLTKSGKYNEKLFHDAAEYGICDFKVIEVPKKSDTAVIINFYGNQQNRIDATKFALKKLKIQCLPIKIFFVELLFDKEKSNFIEELKELDADHIIIRGKEENKDLWQKESLMNIGFKKAADLNYQYLIYLDSDVYSDRCEWFNCIRDTISHNKMKLVQGFRLSKDSKDPKLYFMSLASTHCLGFDSDLPVNPGICWGMSKDYFLKIKKFNPYCICGGGDSGMVVEMLNTKEKKYDTYYCTLRWVNKILRKNINKAIIDCVDINVIHVNHGMYKNRNYTTIRYAIEKLNKKVTDYIHIDKKGLLYWINPKCNERKIIKLRPQMNTIKDVDNIFKKYLK